MITTDNAEKAELVRLTLALMAAVNHECDRETEPCKSIHAEVDRLRDFLTDGDTWKGGLSMADVGEALHDAIVCRCHEVGPVYPSGVHDVHCDLWDPKADEADTVLEVPCCTPEDNVHGHKF